MRYRFEYIVPLAAVLTLTGCSADNSDANSSGTTLSAETTEPIAVQPTTPPSTTSPMPLAGPSPQHSSEYTVQAGDTLYSIARKFDIHLGALLERNGLTVDSVIHPGQVLNVSGQPAPGGGNPPPVPGTKTYTVQPGDGLSDVALRFGGDLGEILRLNGFSSVDTVIYPGQVLTVPDKPGVGPYFPGSGGTTPPPPPLPDVTCGQFNIGATPFNLIAVSLPAGRVGCTEAFTVMEEFIATPGAPGRSANIRGWDCHPMENNFPECTKDGLRMFGTP